MRHRLLLLQKRSDAGVGHDLAFATPPSGVTDLDTVRVHAFGSRLNGIEHLL